jgi:membrane-bound lytic murein transglycosylase D
MLKILQLLLLALVLSACQTTPAPKPEPEPAPAVETTPPPTAVATPYTESIAEPVPGDFDPNELVIGTENDRNTLNYLKPKIIQSPLAIKDDLWNRVRKGYRLDPGYQDERIDDQMSWFLGHQDYLDRVNMRASRYLWYIVEELEKRNMPTEIALLPIIESAYDPFAYSHARASGVWQFMAPTGKLMGLRLDWWYDGRRDILAATLASLDLLQLLHDDLNDDWLLALAAYNSGEGNVLRAIEKNRRRHKPVDFWHLDLPRETKAYVPKLMAVARLYKDPKQYNVYIMPIPNEPYFDVVPTGSQIDLAQAAKLANTPLDELYLLNPAFNRWATSPAGPHYLLVPKENAEPFRMALQDFPPEKRVRWVHYTVKSGDSVSTIAAQFDTTSHDILRSNNLYSSPDNTLRSGTKLMIPVPSSSHYSLSAKERIEKAISLARHDDDNESIAYVVKKGDNFFKIAKLYHVPAKKLAEWNGMAVRDSLRVGKKVTVWVNANNIRPSPVPQVAPDLGSTETPAPDTSAPQTTLATGTTVPVVSSPAMPVNPNPPDSNDSGKKPPLAEDAVEPHPEAASAQPDNNSRSATTAPDKVYQVKKGDTLWKIATKFHLTAQQVSDANGLDPDAPIYKGEELKLPTKPGDTH